MNPEKTGSQTRPWLEKNIDNLCLITNGIIQFIPGVAAWRAFAEGNIQNGCILGGFAISCEFLGLLIFLGNRNRERNNQQRIML